MARSRMISWSGAASIAGGGLWLWSFAPWLLPLMVLAFLLWLVGHVGLHARQARYSGGLGWTGLVLAFAGDLLAFAIVSYLTYARLASNANPMIEGTGAGILFLLGMGSLCVGLVLLGFVALRAKVLAR